MEQLFAMLGIIFISQYKMNRALMIPIFYVYIKHFGESLDAAWMVYP